MSNVHYLRPPERPERTAGQQGDGLRLKVALMGAHLAAVLTGETVTRNGIVPPKVSALAERLSSGPAKVMPRTSITGLARNPTTGPLVQRSNKPPTGGEASAFANAIGASVDAFVAIAVISGRVQLNAVSEGASESQQAALRLKSALIGVPDEILLARQNSTRQVAFSIGSFDVLSDTLSDILRQKRHMVESWAANGGKPALSLRHQARTPFGRIAHPGAEAASDLRAVAVRISRESGPWESFYLIELSLTPRAG